jgi:hypothetical protein
MRRIFTHIRPDLDALASVWFTIRFILQISLEEAKINFVPAYWDGSSDDARGIPSLRDEDLALDIDAGGSGLKGFKSVDGKVYSCFAYLQSMGDLDGGRWSKDHMDAMRPISRFVDVQDSTGNAVFELAQQSIALTDGWGDSQMATKSKQFIALQAASLTSVIHALATSTKTDLGLVKAVLPIFDGLLENGLSRLRAEREADNAEIIGDVAVVRNSKEFATNGILFERGIRYVVFVDGNNMGITRGRGETIPCTNALTKVIIDDSGEGWQSDGGEWFAHSAGFLLARGTRKAPMDSPSKVDPVELAEVMNQSLKTLA